MSFWEVLWPSPAAQISEAKRLPAEGTITESEFERLEAKAMS
nr:hypothetical protein [Nocardia zapadnayensis]